MKYYLVPASGGTVSIACPECTLGLASGDGTKRIVRCRTGDQHLAGEPGVVALTHSGATAKSQQYSDELGDLYTGIGS